MCVVCVYIYICMHIYSLFIFKLLWTASDWLVASSSNEPMPVMTKKKKIKKNAGFILLLLIFSQDGRLWMIDDWSPSVPEKPDKPSEDFYRQWIWKI